MTATMPGGANVHMIVESQLASSELHSMVVHLHAEMSFNSLWHWAPDERLRN
jgi:hypothetical protein